MAIINKTRHNFGFHEIEASIPLHALIRKLILSPVKTDRTIERSATRPPRRANAPLSEVASATATTNAGRPTLQDSCPAQDHHKAKIGDHFGDPTIRISAVGIPHIATIPAPVNRIIKYNRVSRPNQNAVAIANSGIPNRRSFTNRIGRHCGCRRPEGRLPEQERSLDPENF